MKTDLSEPMPEISPFFKPAQEALAREDFDGALAKSLLYLNSTDATIAADAHRIAGLSCFQLGRYAEAATYYGWLTTRNPLWDDWFNLCTSSTMNADFVRGKEAFDAMVTMIEKTGPESVTRSNLPNLIYYYMRALIDMKQYDRAITELNKLRGFYESLKVTDRTYVVGATGAFSPSLESILDAAKPIFTHMGKDAASMWLKDFGSRLDEEGKVLTESIVSQIT